MNAIIVEDELVAVKNLKAIIKDVAPEIKITATFDSIKSSVKYFRENKMPDLVFMDIQLADGESFLIFKEVEITCPVIFTTAYDNYALEAFTVNSIDYLLKPIEPEHVQRALTKLKNFTNADIEMYTKRMRDVMNQNKEYTKTLLIGFRDLLVPLPVAQIAYCFTENEIVTIMTDEGKEWHYDATLESLYTKLDPSAFFRANRQFVIAHKAVKEVAIWFGNRLSISLSVPVKERIIISKARVSAFKKWLAKN